MSENLTSAISEEELSNRNTFHNYRRFLFSCTESMFRDVHNDLKDLSFLKLTLGEFYFNKYLEEIDFQLPQAEKRYLNFLEVNDIQGIDRENYLYYLRLVKERIQELQIYKNQKTSSKFYNSDKFKFGLTFATKNLTKYIKGGRIGPNYTAPKIARELQIPKGEKSILATLNDYQENNSNFSKNFFRNLKEMENVEEYCTENNLTMTPFFLEKLNDLKSKQGR